MAIFFEELSPTEPFLNLSVGRGSHAQQTAKVMMCLEKILQQQKPQLVIARAFFAHYFGR
jgi:UDP-N-acetylglucosamine 2-epimerase (non-hydrolysing)